MQPIFELSKLCLTHCTRLLRKLWRHLFVVLCECQTRVFKRLKKKKETFPSLFTLTLREVKSAACGEEEGRPEQRCVDFR